MGEQAMEGKGAATRAAGGCGLFGGGRRVVRRRATGRGGDRRHRRVGVDRGCARRIPRRTRRGVRRVGELVLEGHVARGVNIGISGLQRVVDNLCQAQAAVREGLGEEIVAAEIRIALVELGKVVGTIYTDDILDRVFSRFCIGK